jgi:hypothetical protein
MQIKNNHELAPLQLHAYINKNKVVTYPCPHSGKELKKFAKPELKLIHVPAGYTVEVDDTLWLAATEGHTTVKIFEEHEEKIEGVDLGKDAVATRKVRTDTGRTKRVNLVKEMIKAGRITIVEQVASTLTKQEKQQALKDAGVPTTAEMGEEALDALHAKVCL